jgi:hypothetical protein
MSEGGKTRPAKEGWQEIERETELDRAEEELLGKSTEEVAKELAKEGVDVERVRAKTREQAARARRMLEAQNERRATVSRLFGRRNASLAIAGIAAAAAIAFMVTRSPDEDRDGNPTAHPAPVVDAGDAGRG